MASRSTRGSAACQVMSRLWPPAERQKRRCSTPAAARPVCSSNDRSLKIAHSPHSRPHFERSAKSAASRNQRVAKNRFLVASLPGMKPGNFNNLLSNGAQILAQDLADGGLRQRVEEAHLLRDLVARQIEPAVRDDLLVGHAGARGPHHEEPHCFA